MVEYIEKVVRFRSGLVGIQTESQETAASSDLPCVILLNSGIVHRVGTCRLSVKLTRALAAKGYHCLRYDSSGIGDSPPRKDTKPFEESAPLELQEVMDSLQSTKGVEKFVVIGLCSGADVAYETAKIDSRICGIAQIDPYSYKNWKYYWKYYWPRVTNIDTWVRLIKRKLSGGGGKAADAVVDDLELPTYIRVFPPKDSVRDGLKRLASRDVKIYAIFTGSAEYLYQEQFADVFSDVEMSELLTVTYLDNSDHMVTTLPEQRQLVSLISNWTTETWGLSR